MPRPDKVQKVNDVSESLNRAKSIFMTDFTGLSVEEMTILRREFRKADVHYVVVKNTLAKLSAEKSGFDNMVKFLNGPTGLAMSFDDPVAPIRIIDSFQKQYNKPSIKAAIVEGELLDEQATQEIRNIPSRDVLLGQVVSGIASPISGLVGGLQGLFRNLVYALDAIKDKKES